LVLENWILCILQCPTNQMVLGLSLFDLYNLNIDKCISKISSKSRCQNKRQHQLLFFEAKGFVWAPKTNEASTIYTTPVSSSKERSMQNVPLRYQTLQECIGKKLHEHVMRTSTLWLRYWVTRRSSTSIWTNL